MFGQLDLTYDANVQSRAALAQQIRELMTAFNAAEVESDDDRIQIRSNDDVAQLFAPILEGLDHEELHVAILDTKNHVVRTVKLYQGTVNSCPVRVAEIFRQAVIDNAFSIVIAHNHPSGDPTPSPEDVRMTSEVIKAGKILDIDVLDHIIIGSNGRHTSLRQRRLGFA